MNSAGKAGRRLAAVLQCSPQLKAATQEQVAGLKRIVGRLM